MDEEVEAQGVGQTRDVGVVVHVHRDGLACEVEFTTLDGKTAAVVTLEAAKCAPSASAKSPALAN